MCGISAVFDLKSVNPIINGVHDTRAALAAKLDRSVETQRHRGPDAKGVWTSPDGHVGLAHVRLSTRDLTSAGHQPLHSPSTTDDIHVVVNGELYYEPELRERLEKTYEFTSTSDSEMAIALYRSYGTAFLEYLRGEFSLVLYDGREKKLVVARDRFGVKPLHYGIFDGQLLVATQCKGVVELLKSREHLHWDVKCIAQGGGHYGSRTLFEGIKKVPPAHVLIVHQDGEDALEFKPYWRTRYPENSGHTDVRPVGELVEQLRAELLEAVRLRLFSSDVPIGVLLSGGVDSSAVAGMAAHLAKQRLGGNDGTALPLPTCFTIGYPDDGDEDESAIAARTAEHLGLPIEKVLVTEQMLADQFEESVWLGEALMWDLQHIAKKAMSKHISSRGLKVVLNGDGSDELFGGYAYFASDRLEADDELRAIEYQEATSEQRKIARKQQAKGVKWFGIEATLDEEQSPFAKSLGLPPGFCKLAVSTHHDWLLKELTSLGDPFQAIHETFTPEEIEEMVKLHPMHRAMWAWHKTVLPNMVIAAISDGAEMAHSVESRPPFLDHIVAELAQTFSPDTLVHLAGDEKPTEKWIFREAVKPYVTDEIYRRRKQAFAAPFRWKKGGPLHSKLQSLISYENVQNLGFADWTWCENAVESCYDNGDELLFRKFLWLAQVISLGRQFGIQTWTLDVLQVDRGFGT